MVQRCILLCLILLIHSSVSATQPVKVFKVGTYVQLLEQHKNPFLLVFWSLDCPPCYKELSILSEVLQSQPQLDLILVSTDKLSDIKKIHEVLSEFNLSHISAWVFANDISQKLRYEIDPGWYGELPRSYLFDVQHNRQVISGVLKPATLQRWKNLQAKVSY